MNCTRSIASGPKSRKFPDVCLAEATVSIILITNGINAYITPATSGERAASKDDPHFLQLRFFKCCLPGALKLAQNVLERARNTMTTIYRRRHNRQTWLR